MVKLDELPEEADRIQLDKLSRFLDHIGGEVELIATGEDWQQGGKNKTEGLKIHLITKVPYSVTFDMRTEDPKEEVTDEPVLYEEGLPVTQLYGKMASVDLKMYLGLLELDDTESLQESFYFYKLVPQRQGYARLMPFRKA